MQLWEVTASESLMVHLYLFSLGSIWMYCIGMNINVKSLNYCVCICLCCSSNVFFSTSTTSL
jgi:hypothetical protein